MTDDYQDGIKLPTDEDISTWKEKVGENVTFARAKIEGGHLYYLIEGNGVCFVPDNKPELSEDDTFILMNKVAELSTKLNAMQDSLREFEKQKVEPCFKKVDEVIDGMWNKIQKLEEHTHPQTHNLIDMLFVRVNKLEEHHARQIDENRKVSNLINAMDNDMFNLLSSRIEKLEGNNDRQLEEYCSNAQRNYEIVRDTQQKLDERIEKLEEILPRYDELHKEWWKRIEKLEKHHTRQIDENRKLFRRIEGTYDINNVLTERIEKLESLVHKLFYTNCGGTLPENEKQECQHEWETNLGLLLRKCKKCDYKFKMPEFIETGHPRDEVKLCKHMLIESKCTACY